MADLRKLGWRCSHYAIRVSFVKLKQRIVVKIVIGGGSLEVLGFKNHRQKLTETETETHPQASCD